MQYEKSLETALIGVDGRVKGRVNHETNSIVQAFPNILHAQFGQTVNGPQVTDITGTDRDLQERSNSFRVVNSTSPTGVGVAFGSGSTAVTYDDFDLDSRITSNVTYNSGTASISQSDTQTTIEIERTLNNDGTATITAAEAGVTAEAVDEGGSTRGFLIIRDVLDSSLDVDPNESLLGRYTIEFIV